MILVQLKTELAVILMLIFVALATGGYAIQHAAVAVVGKHVEILKCNTSLDFSVTVYFTPSKTPFGPPIEIYDRNAFLGEHGSCYTMERRHPGQYILETNLSQHHQAGRYQCYDNEGIGPLRSETELTILDSEPICESTSMVEFSHHVLRCQVPYSGNYPELEFQCPAQLKTVVEPSLNETTEQIQNSVVIIITVKSNQSSAVDHEYPCTMVYRSDSCDCKDGTCKQDIGIRVPGITTAESSDTSTAAFANTAGQHQIQMSTLVILTVVGLVLSNINPRRETEEGREGGGVQDVHVVSSGNRHDSSWLNLNHITTSVSIEIHYTQKSTVFQIGTLASVLMGYMYQARKFRE